VAHGYATNEDCDDTTILTVLCEGVSKEAEEEAQHNFCNDIFGNKTSVFEDECTQYAYICESFTCTQPNQKRIN
jgi:hypothetical protein